MRLVYFNTVYSLGAQKPVVKKALTAGGGGGGYIHTCMCCHEGYGFQAV